MNGDNQIVEGLNLKNLAINTEFFSDDEIFLFVFFEKLATRFCEKLFFGDR